MKNNKPFNIPNILESYRRDVLSGVITLEKAAEKLAQAGWNLGIVDLEKTKNLLHIG